METYSRGAVDDAYLKRVEQRYHRLIEMQLGHVVTANAAGTKFSVVKAPGLDKWDGSSDIDKFEEFLMQFCRWCKVNHLGGPYRSQEIISHLGLHLTGAPQRWFSSHVDGVTSTRTWTLLEVVMGLYRQFVHDTAIQQATDRFNAIHGARSVYKLYEKLRSRAENMVEPPDALTFKIRFLTALPEEVRNYVFEHRHSAERSTMGQLFHSAQAGENAFADKRRYKDLAKGKIVSDERVRSQTGHREENRSRNGFKPRHDDRRSTNFHRELSSSPRSDYSRNQPSARRRSTSSVRFANTPRYSENRTLRVDHPQSQRNSSVTHDRTQSQPVSQSDRSQRSFNSDRSQSRGTPSNRSQPRSSAPQVPPVPGLE